MGISLLMIRQNWLQQWMVMRLPKNSSFRNDLFWNSVEPQTAGVGFNIVNQKGHKHDWLRGLLGVSVQNR